MKSAIAWAMVLVCFGCSDNTVTVTGQGLPGPSAQLVLEVPQSAAAGSVIEVPVRLLGPVRDFGYAALTLDLGHDRVAVRKPKPELPANGSAVTFAGVGLQAEHHLVVGVSVFDTSGAGLDLPGIGESMELGYVRLEALSELSTATWHVVPATSSARERDGAPLGNVQFSIRSSDPTP